MNEKFYELPQEKQLRIINAGFEVFSQNEYKKASTEEIARIAQTSKGLLFYYFHNKKELYLFLYKYAEKIITEEVINAEYEKIKDFFQLCEYAAKRKYELLERTPYVSDFVVRAFYSQREDVSDDMNNNMNDATTQIFEQYFQSVDFSKFKDDIKPLDILQMLMWMTDGYIHEKQRSHIPLDLEELMKKHAEWARLLKQTTYKEEYLR